MQWIFRQLNPGLEVLERNFVRPTKVKAIGITNQRSLLLSGKNLQANRYITQLFGSVGELQKFVKNEEKMAMVIFNRAGTDHLFFRHKK